MGAPAATVSGTSRTLFAAHAPIAAGSAGDVVDAAKGGELGPPELDTCSKTVGSPNKMATPRPVATIAMAMNSLLNAVTG